MSTLTISIVEVRVFGSDSVLCGFLADDGVLQRPYLPAQSWHELRKLFPTVQSVVDHVTSQDDFLELEGQCVVGPEGISFVDKRLYTGFDEVIVVGGEFLSG